MSKTESADLDKLQRTDHDTLVRLETKVDTFVGQYAIDMKEVKDGTALKLSDHENRLGKVEKTIDEFQPVAILKTINENNVWIHDYRLTWKFMLTAAVVIGAVISWVVTNLATWLHLGK